MDEEVKKAIAEFGAKWMPLVIRFKEAAETLGEILEDYGVTVEKLEKVSADIDAGIITKRQGWARLGLPVADYPE